jgi:hypothetical protein
VGVTFEERWANPPDSRVTPGGPATVAAAQGVVPAGTVQTWAMTGGWPLFPTADPTALPPVIFRIFDLGSAEIVRVTDSRTANWQVVRGDQGSPVTAHAAGFAVYNAISSAGLSSLARGVPSGNGLNMPGSGLTPTPPATWTDGAQHDVVSLPIPTDPGPPARNEIGPGCIYEALVWGWFWNVNTANRFSGGVYWNVVSLGRVSWPCPTAMANATVAARWRIHAVVNVTVGVPGTYNATCNAILTIADRTAVDLAPFPYTVMFGRETPIGIQSVNAVPFRIWVQQTGGIWVQGRRAWKAA